MLLNIDGKYDKNIKIIGYEILKGVWENKRYPIIWFLRDETLKDILNSFHYDERFSNPTVEKVINSLEDNNLPELNKKNFFQIFEYLGLLANIEKMRTELDIPKRNI